MWLCPYCIISSWATGARPERQYERLAAFAKARALKPEQEFYEKSLEALRK